MDFASALVYTDRLWKVSWLHVCCLCLSQELTDDFIFPASNVYLQYVKSGEFPAEQAIPVCSSPASINAGFELLVALAVGCVRNLKQIADTLTDMYYLGTDLLHIKLGLSKTILVRIFVGFNIKPTFECKNAAFEF